MMTHIKPCTIYLIRHAQSHSNAGTDIYSGSDGLGSHITELGRGQAMTLAHTLHDVHFSAYYSSDLTRAMQTAKILAPSDSPIITSSALRERIYGRSEEEIHLANKEFNARYDHDDSLSAEQKYNLKVNPWMESSRDVLGRFIPYLRDICAHHEGETIAVISHGNTLRTFLIELGFATPHQLPAGAIKNVGYAVISYENQQWKVHETDGIVKSA